MKKVVVILGSPRINGNSATLAYQAIEGIRAVHGRYETFHLNKMHIRPCQACGYCQSGGKKQCILKDDMRLIDESLGDADALLIASPIYMFSVSAQLKLFMDRCYAFTRKLEGKKIGILLTYGDPDAKTSGVLNAINTLKDEYRYAKSEIVQILHASADAPGAVAANDALMEQAYILGKLLAE